MKWIKLFENFENDKLDDVKDILRLHFGELEEVDFTGGDLQVEMSDSLKNRIRVYRLLESPNVRDLTAFEEHFNEEDIRGVFYNVNLNWYNNGKVAIIGIGKSIEEFLGEWLGERFSGLMKYDRELSIFNGYFTANQVFYLDKNRSGVFYYYENDTQDKSVHVSSQKIWGFFKTVLGLEDSQIETIVKDWIWDEFGLDLEPKMW